MSPAHDLVVVGAGPAGAAAALAAADAGLDVLVVDEQRAAGGQIFRTTPPEFGARRKLPTGYPWAGELLDRARSHPGIAWRHGATVFGILPVASDASSADGADASDPSDPSDASARPAPAGFDVLTSDPAGPASSGRVRARRVLIAAGAYDMPVAIPGWTLPGVMMAGAVQGFLKSQRLRVADRVVLAGSHPLLLIVADQLLAAGARIEEVAIARGIPSPVELLRALPAVPGHVRLLGELAGCVLRLLRAGVRISTGTVPTEVLGDGRVQAVRLARADRGWRQTGPARTVEADALVLGYGFHPSTELARQLGCGLDWDSAQGGWIVRHDAQLETTVPGVHVAGEPSGVAGAEQSRAEGELAGLTIAAALGRPVPERALAGARRRIRSSSRFSSVVQRMFAPRREALLELATPATEICRCETVTRATIDGFLDENPFAGTADAVKLACRSGMGPCQGRYCESAVAGLVAKARGTGLGQAGRFAAHIPVKPVPLQAYVALADDPD